MFRRELIGLVALFLAFAAGGAQAQEQTELKTFSGHDRDVFAVAFSADGNRLASGSVDQTVRVWDVKTGKLLLTLKGHTFSVRSVAFSPTGKQLASSCHDGTIKIWDLTSKKEVRNLPVKNPGGAVAFSPDGKTLIANVEGSIFTKPPQKGAIVIWNAASGKELRRIVQPTAVGSMSLSRDGKLAATGSSEGPSRIWDLGTTKEIAVLGVKGDHAEGGVALLPDA
jgi:WD40 repeat protein